MPFFGIGLHVIIALFFAIHAVRTGREIYWLMILFFFPLLGSIVYFFAIYLPDTQLQQHARKGTAVVANMLDPGKDLREAKQAFDLTPTAQNQMRLARALLDNGNTAEAVQHYEACLKGPFANDAEIRLGAARAHLQNGQGGAAIALAEAIRQQDADFRPEQLSLLLAQAYAQVHRNEDARTEFMSAVVRFGSMESHVEYAIWALGVGEAEIAAQQQKEIQNAMKHWSKHTHSINKPLLRRLEAAFATQPKA